MHSGKFRSMLAASLIAFCLTTVSIGGAYSTAFADAADETQENQGDASQSVTSNKAAIGLAALGLLAILSSGHHGQDQNSTTGVTQTPAAPSTQAPATTTTQPSTKTTTTTSSTARTGSASDQQRAFDLLNADRVANGLPALQMSGALDNLAQKYAEDMINRHFFAHTDPDGKSPFDRMRAAGISFGYAGENLAINTSVSSAEDAFMHSAGHRANILSANYKTVGVGVAYDANGSVYVVQEFADR